MVDSVSYDAHRIEIICDGGNLFRFLVNDYDIVVFAAKLLYESIAYLATAYDNDLHDMVTPLIIV